MTVVVRGWPFCLALGKCPTMPGDREGRHYAKWEAWICELPCVYRRGVLVLSYTTSVHFFGNAVGAPLGFSRFRSQMTPSQRPIL